MFDLIDLVAKYFKKKRNLFHLSILVLGALLVGIYFLSNPIIEVLSAGGASYFSNLSANLRSNVATFNFTYSGPISETSCEYYMVDISTTSSFGMGGYYKGENGNFAGQQYCGPGTISQLVVQNPQLYSFPNMYVCGSTIYWRARVWESNKPNPNHYNVHISDVQKATIDCSL